jgi:hypothetical protein
MAFNLQTERIEVETQLKLFKSKFDNYVSIYNGINTGDNPYSQSRARQSGKLAKQAEMVQLIKTIFKFDIQTHKPETNFYLYDLLNYINNKDPNLDQTRNNLSKAFLGREYLNILIKNPFLDLKYSFIGILILFGRKDIATNLFGEPENVFFYGESRKYDDAITMVTSASGGAKKKRKKRTIRKKKSKKLRSQRKKRKTRK